MYNLEPTLDHNECASIFNAAGIYMILDVNTPFATGSLSREKPWDSYNGDYFKQVFGVIEAFKNFDNVLGFFAGNEVVNEDATYMTPVYVRAVIRDMKDYIAKNSKRTIPVGYSAADIRTTLMDTAHYFECSLKNSTTSNADFFGVNSYSWCGDASYKSSGYSTLTEDFSNATIPVFFSEYGCNEVTPRTWTEVESLYGEDMMKSFSGGLVYEWTEEDNHYGLVAVNGSGKVTTLVDYENLQKQFNKLDMKQIEAANASQTDIETEECDASFMTSGTFYNAWDLPKVPSKVSDYIESGLPSAPSGSWVSVTATTISDTVYDSSGKELSGIEFKVLSDTETNGPDSTGSSSSGGSSSTSNAASVNGAPLAMGGIGGLFMLIASLL